MKIAGQSQMLKMAAKFPGLQDAMKAKLGPNHSKARLTGLAHRVNLSAKAQRLSHLSKLRPLTPEARAETLEHIKDNIEDGKYGDKSVKAAKYLMRKAVDFYKGHTHPL
ncbi:MAG: hypothetical protein ACE5DW_04205 [Thermodesulfobacteriota bacterium]